jgi:hypothetical protein
VSTPRHSVVMAAHDAEATLELCARSVLEQRNPDLELIVVDDGSIDATPAIAARLAEADSRVVIRSQQQSGPSAARNAGLDAARGEFVTFLDSDDFVTRGWLDTMQAAMAARPGTVLAYADAWILDRGHDRIRTELLGHEGWHFVPTDDPPSDPAECLALLAAGNFIGGVRMALRETAIEAGGFDPSLRYAEDYDLWLRMLQTGGGLIHVHERLAVISDTPGSLSKNALEMERSIAVICRRLRDADGSSEAVRVAAGSQLGAIEQRIPRYESRARERLRHLRVAAGRAIDRLQPDKHWHGSTPPELLAELPLLSEL